MSDDLNLILKMLSDEQSFKKTAKDLGTIEDGIVDIGVATGDIKKNSTKDLAGAGKEIETIAVFTKAKLTPALKEATDQWKLQRQELKLWRLQLRESGMAIREFSQISGLLLGAGGLTYGAIMAGATLYVKNAKVATETTKEWTKATDNLQNSSMRMGAVFADVALPYMQQMAKLMSYVADIIEKNPGVISAGMKFGVFAVAVGTIGKLITQGLRMYQDKMMEMLMTAQIAAMKANTQAIIADTVARGGVPGSGGIPTLGGTLKKLTPYLAMIAKFAGGIGIGVTAALAGVGIGKTIYNAMNPNKQVDESVLEISTMMIKDAGKTLSRLGTIGLATFGTLKDGAIALFEGRDAMVAMAKSLMPGGTAFALLSSKAPELTKEQIKKASGSVEESESRYVRATEASVKYKLELEQKFIDAALKAATARKELVGITSEIEADYAKTIAKLNAQKMTAIENYARQEIEALAEYNKQRADAVRNYSKDVQRAEEDHQRTMLEMQKDHDDRVHNLVDQRDALGLVRENKEYAERRDKAEDDYELATARRSEDWALQLADMEYNYRKQRLERRNAFIQQIKDINKEMTVAADARRASLLQAQADYQQFVANMKAIGAQLRNLNPYSLGGGSSSTSGGGGGSKNKAVGGYATYGNYTLGELGKEFVLTNQATKAAEQLVGGTLSQDKLLRALAGNRYQDNRNMAFSGVTESDRHWIRRQVQREVNGMLTGAFK